MKRRQNRERGERATLPTGKKEKKRRGRKEERKRKGEIWKHRMEEKRGNDDRFISQSTPTRKISMVASNVFHKKMRYNAVVELIGLRMKNDCC